MSAHHRVSLHSSALSYQDRGGEYVGEGFIRLTCIDVFVRACELLGIDPKNAFGRSIARIEAGKKGVFPRVIGRQGMVIDRKLMLLVQMLS